MVDTGISAPDFTLQSEPGRSRSLADYRGRALVLAFYPADWSPVCGDQMTLYNELRSEFDRLDAELVGISVDGVWCHAAFRKARNLKLTLLSDFEPKGEVARRYGAYDATEGTAERALVVIDAEGTVRWTYLSPPDVNPGADGILTALEELHSEGAASRGAT